MLWMCLHENAERSHQLAARGGIDHTFEELSAGHTSSDKTCQSTVARDILHVTLHLTTAIKHS